MLRFSQWPAPQVAAAVRQAGAMEVDAFLA